MLRYAADILTNKHMQTLKEIQNTIFEITDQLFKKKKNSLTNSLGMYGHLPPGAGLGLKSVSCIVSYIKTSETVDGLCGACCLVRKNLSL